MWYLINSEGRRVYVKPKEELTFGRKKSDILLQDDDSISRIHASIAVEPKEIVQLNEPVSSCRIKDEGSKYGTYILKDDQKIQVSDEGYLLNNKDVIRFGLQHHIYTVVYEPTLTAVSSLDDADRAKLQTVIDEIDGVVCINWTSCCTHLTVSKAALTEKVAWSMASAIPIVTIKYWEELKHAIDNGKEFPKPDNFVPLISENLINKQVASLCPNEKRKTLFKDLIFVNFSASQYKSYGKMINIAGGKSLLYSKRPLSNKEICAPNVIVLQYPGSDATLSTQSTEHPEYDSIYNLLKKNKRRMVAETEIALAILYCSIEKHCNPKYLFKDILKRSQAKIDSSKVLAPDTLDVDSDIWILPKVISNVPVTSKLNIRNAKNSVVIIPETYDGFDLNDSSGNDSPYQSEGSLIAHQKHRNEGRSTSKKKKVEDVEEHVQKDIHFIPETIDSSGSYSVKNVTQNTIEYNDHFKPQFSSTQNIETLKESIVANNGTPFSGVRDFTANGSDVSEVAQGSAKKDNRFSEMFRKRGRSKSPEMRNIIAETPDIEEISYPGNSNIYTPRKANVKTTSRVTLSAMERIDKQSGKKSKEACELIDENFIEPVRKKPCLSEINTDTRKSQQCESSSSIETANSSSSLPRYSSSFLRLNTDFKKFKKVYNKIPEKRITMDDMYIWNETVST